MDKTRIRAVIEATLFASGAPVSFGKLAGVLDISSGEVRDIISEYADFLTQSGSGLEVVLFDDSVQLVTRPEYGDYIRAVLGTRRSAPLSKAALEVLAVVAYNQPVTRSFIEQVRGGVECGSIVSSLTEKGLLEERGRLELPGRPVLYGTTQDFLRMFGLSSLLELPEVESFTPPSVKED